MRIDNSYYEDEVREGFYIPGIIKRSMAAQLQVLDEVKKICDRHDIKWFADYGTLMGAVRHHGFIPWDDDLDICMLQSDYLHFLSYAREELPEGYRLLNLDTEPEYTNFLTRIVNNDTINTNMDFLLNNHGFPYTTGIDIFPLTYVYGDENKERERCEKARKLWDIQEKLALENNKEQVIDIVETISGYSIDRNFSLECNINRILEKLFFECKEDEAGKVVQASFYIRFNNHIYPSKYFEKIVKLPFEGGEINAPLCYENKLSLDYGNWAVANQAGGLHDYPFFLEQEDILSEHCNGRLPYRYNFSKEDIICSKRQEHKKETDICLKYFDILESIYPIFEKVIIANQKENIVSLAAKCQELAINIGTTIENNQGDPKVVECLEKYCEKLFEICQCNNELDNISDRKLYEQLLQLHIASKDTYICSRSQTKIVLFLVSSPAKWKYMEPLYLIYKRDEALDVRLMPIPYYDKLIDKSIVNEHYDGSFFSEKYNIEDYKEFDFNNIHVDEIITQEPFDEYSQAVSIHPFFYISNIKNYTDRLIYIPGFKTDSIEDRCEKAKANVKYYAITPGVLQSDCVMLGSDEEKKIYLDTIEKELGTDIRDICEDKIIVLSDNETDTADNVLNKKKKLAVYFSEVPFSEDEENAIAKLKAVIQTLVDNKDKIEVTFLWEKYLFEDVCDKGLVAKIENIFNRFKDEQAGDILILSATTDMSTIVNEHSAYYGSPGYIMNQFARVKKPIMIANYKI